MLNVFLQGIFFLVGLHIPKAFTLLYVALGLSTLVELRGNTPAREALLSHDRCFRFIQVAVVLFSVAYAVGMLHFGFWSWFGRDRLDVISVLLLPGWMFWWGRRMAAKNSRLLARLLFAYGLGALLYIVLAMMRTRGLMWFVPGSDPASLLLPWGQSEKMNVRSVEQNGILALVWLLLSVWMLLRSRIWPAIALLAFAVLGWFAVVPLAGGRLWIPSLLLACLPLTTLLFYRLRRWQLTALGVASVVFILRSLKALFSSLCDERFELYRQALIRWPELIGGGRRLEFSFSLCSGELIPYSAAGRQLSSSPMLHNVFLDVFVSVGWPAGLALVVVGSWALICLAQALRVWFAVHLQGWSMLWIVLWCYVAVLVPQWMFQPLIYGDGLLFFLSFACLGGLSHSAFDYGLSKSCSLES
jgi:hypothetical protein